MTCIWNLLHGVGRVRWLTGAVVWLAVAGSSAAQTPERALVRMRGLMVDSAGRAIPGVSLRVVGSGRSATSDSVGEFSLDSLPAGTVAIAFAHPRFSSITIEVPLDVDDNTRIPVMLAAFEGPAARDVAPATLFGRVLDGNGFPIRDAEVLVASNGQTIVTDTLGQFSFASLVPGPHLLRVRRIGFYAQYLTVTTTSASAVRAQIVLEAMGTSLGAVVVRADRVPLRLQRFFDRRAHNGLGQFAAREDFVQKRWTSLTDVLAHMRGVMIGGDDMGRPTPMTQSSCPMAVLLDGLPLILDAVSLSAMVNLRDLAGVEVYQHVADAPLEFRFGVKESGRCGMIILWTR